MPIARRLVRIHAFSVLSGQMKFQGSGFAVDLPEGAIDASAYAFVFPVSDGEATGFAPNITIRFQAFQEDLNEHVEGVAEGMLSALENAALVAKDEVRARGNWRYLTQVIEWGEGEFRMRQKQLFLVVPEPKPTLYSISGTDFTAQFARSEPIFDQIIRSFDPNGVQSM